MQQINFYQRIRSLLSDPEEREARSKDLQEVGLLRSAPLHQEEGGLRGTTATTTSNNQHVR